MKAFPPGPMSAVDRSFLRIINDLSYETNLQILLDAADYNSYPGSGQTWSDVSGNDQHFILGESAGDATGDPSFVGIAGAGSLDEYFQHSGASYHDYNTSPESWMDAFRQDDAQYTIMTWFYTGSLGLVQALMEFARYSIFSVLTEGVSLRFFENIEFIAVRDSTTLVEASTTGEVNPNAWNFTAISVDETNENGIIYLNGVDESFNCNYAAAGTPGASIQYATTAYTAHMTNQGRVAIVAVWTRALSATELDNIYAASRKRFGV